MHFKIESSEQKVLFISREYVQRISMQSEPMDPTFVFILLQFTLTYCPRRRVRRLSVASIECATQKSPGSPFKRNRTLAFIYRVYISMSRATGTSSFVSVSTSSPKILEVSDVAPLISEARLAAQFSFDRKVNSHGLWTVYLFFRVHYRK